MLGDFFKNKLGEKNLEISENRYRRVFEAAQDGILLLDFQTGKIIDVNKFLIDMLGFTKGWDYLRTRLNKKRILSHYRKRGMSVLKTCLWRLRTADISTLSLWRTHTKKLPVL
ncbi:MAG: Signal transduction histidine kinase [Candidatus Collierbacteria bacterium GW2011_GWC2_44_18]|uniref:Signal transduction histidine kinase n=1 Tax=Candidatus Collierbacteria bacterium GW2011_GWC2_44_18 TaxID=1618392 RepID=A0A0G1HQ42_9BACT|nr:MAG: Signal transduction histidine kinase [Candidatus Collierbacteria bacterium GW2011_GWC2_44_18]